MTDSYKKLHRSRKSRVIAGVAGGVAEYFGIDPTVVRLLFVLLAFTTGGMFVLVYLLAILIIPEEPVA